MTISSEQVDTPTSQVASEAAVIAPVSVRARPSPGVIACWLVAVAALAGFILFARVPIEAGWFPGLRTDRVLAIWSDFGDRLSDSTTRLSPLALAVYAALLLFLVLAAVGLWFALTTPPFSLREERTADEPSDA